MIYTVTLNPALDYILHPTALEPGRTNRAPAPLLVAGGKGINVSLMLHRLGQDTVPLGLCAGRTGKLLLDDMAEKGLSPAFIHTCPDGGAEVWTRINVKICVPGGGETEVNVPGPAAPAGALDRLLDIIREKVQKNDTLVLAGSVPPGLSDRVFGDIMLSVTDKNVRVVVDTTGTRLRASLPFQPYLIKPNRAELEELIGHPLPTDSDLIHAARSLQSLGAGHVLISLGGDGCLFVPSATPRHNQSARGDTDLRGDCLRMRACKGVVRSTVGAGDSMIAGFLTALSRGWTPEKILRYATAAGAATAFAEGLGTRAEVDALFALSTLSGETKCTHIKG